MINVFTYPPSIRLARVAVAGIQNENFVGFTHMHMHIHIRTYRHGTKFAKKTDRREACKSWIGSRVCHPRHYRRPSLDRRNSLCILLRGHEEKSKKRVESHC